MAGKTKQFRFDTKHQADGLVLLASMKDRSAALAWFDPQYREVLDKLKFGNEGKRQRKRAELPQMTPAQIAAFMEEIQRVLKRGGYLMLWVDKFLLATGHWRRWLPHGTSLCTVDLAAWDKVRFGMGRRTRCVTEYLVILQKGPTSGKNWTDHSIRDCAHEPADPSGHAHAKPFQLILRLIKATTKRGDIVIDPAAGGFTVLKACRHSGRKFLGCDLMRVDDGR